MKNIINFGSFLLTIYLVYNYNGWTLLPNTENIISSYFVNTIHLIPEFFTTIIICGLIVIYMWSLVTKKQSLILYIISLVLLHALTKISIDMLMLKDNTTFVLFNLLHSIPLEIKAKYFSEILFEAININQPEIFTNRDLITQFHETLNTNFNMELLRPMNAAEIRIFAYNILEFHVNILDQLNKDLLKNAYIVATGYIFWAAFSVFFSVIKNVINIQDNN